MRGNSTPRERLSALLSQPERVVAPKRDIPALLEAVTPIGLREQVRALCER